MAFKDEAEFKSWCCRMDYDERTIILIQRIRSLPPSRNVTGRRGNVHARVPSHKMGVTIQSESRTSEKPGIRVFYEHDHMLENQAERRVLEYYDQPDKIALKYVSGTTERTITAWHTPDFFVIRETGAGWEEWKTEAELITLAEKQPNRYQKDEQGTWRCLPGEVYAAQFGLSYRLRSNIEIDWNLFNNLEFLHEYLVATHLTVLQSSYDNLLTYVDKQQGITLKQLLQAELATIDDVYLLIARRELYVDLRAARLTEPERVKVYTNRTAAEAHQRLLGHLQDFQTWHVLDIQPGTALTWDGQSWFVVNLGVSEVRLRHVPSNHIQDIARSEFETALATGKIAGALPSEEMQQTQQMLQTIWAAATEADYAVANARLHILKALERGTSLQAAWSENGIQEILGPLKTSRTIREWRKQFAEAEQMWGNGYAGLLPKIQQRGNYQPKLSEATSEKMQMFIETRYEDLRQSHITSVWAEYCRACELDGITPASLKTFGQVVKNRPLDSLVQKRQGQRAAHQVQKRYWYLEPTTPKHGERSWHIVHIDHTELDIQLRHSRTGKLLGRPWATFAVDAYSRRLLAVVLTLDDQPSYRSCMLVLRELARRYHRLPQIIYVDNGKEFYSTYFQALLAQYAVEVAYRPSAQPRFGAVVERLFLTANTEFVNNLTGNTQIAKQIRLMTKSNNPENLAIWQLDWLYLALREWAYETYDQSEHTTLGQSPREAFEESLLLHGERAFKWINYDNFVLNALPTPERGNLRMVHPNGVKIEHIYYWHDWMYRPDVRGTLVPVRYDPFNAGVAYAYLDKTWVRCTSEYYAVFNNRTEQELQIAREELCASFRRHGQVVRTLNAKLLADFLERTTAVERLLKQQERDDAMHFVRSSITDNLTDETLNTRLNEFSESQSILPRQSGTGSLPAPTARAASYEHLTLPDDF